MTPYTFIKRLFILVSMVSSLALGLTVVWPLLWPVLLATMGISLLFLGGFLVHSGLKYLANKEYSILFCLDEVYSLPLTWSMKAKSICWAGSLLVSVAGVTAIALLPFTGWVAWVLIALLSCQALLFTTYGVFEWIVASSTVTWYHYRCAWAYLDEQPPNRRERILHTILKLYPLDRLRQPVPSCDSLAYLFQNMDTWLGQHDKKQGLDMIRSCYPYIQCRSGEDLGNIIRGLKALSKDVVALEQEIRHWMHLPDEQDPAETIVIWLVSYTTADQEDKRNIQDVAVDFLQAWSPLEPLHPLMQRILSNLWPYFVQDGCNEINTINLLLKSLLHTSLDTQLRLLDCEIKGTALYQRIQTEDDLWTVLNALTLTRWKVSETAIRTFLHKLDLVRIFPKEPVRDEYSVQTIWREQHRTPRRKQLWTQLEQLWKADNLYTEPLHHLQEQKDNGILWRWNPPSQWRNDIGQVFCWIVEHAPKSDQVRQMRQFYDNLQITTCTHLGVWWGKLIQWIPNSEWNIKEETRRLLGASTWKDAQDTVRRFIFSNERHADQEMIYLLEGLSAQDQYTVWFDLIGPDVVNEALAVAFHMPMNPLVKVLKVLTDWSYKQQQQLLEHIDLSRIYLLSHVTSVLKVLHPQLHQAIMTKLETQQQGCLKCWFDKTDQNDRDAFYQALSSEDQQWVKQHHIVQQSPVDDATSSSSNLKMKRR